MINNLLAGFFENIIKIFSNVKYLEMIFEGLKVTFIISLGASLLGLILGTLVAMVKIVADAKDYIYLSSRPNDDLSKAIDEIKKYSNLKIIKDRQ